MKLRFSLALLCIVLGLNIAACQKAENDPTPAPDQESVAAARTLFAQPTPVPRLTVTVTPVSGVELELNRVVARMEQAVLAGDAEGYLAYVWDGDGVFWSEHRHWVQDWVEHPLSVFDIQLFSIRSESDRVAKARMSTQWRLEGSLGSGAAGGATTSVVFYRKGETWVLGGEDWSTLDAPGFVLYHFADPVVDNTSQAKVMLEYLPSIFTVLTREFGYTPADTAHLKVYENPTTLQNWTRLSMPDIDRWNEPGEAIKIPLGLNDTVPLETDVAREYTRFLLYEMGGNSHGAFPWWLEQGIADYGANLFRTLSQRNRDLKRVAARTQTLETSEERLFDWEALNTTPSLLDDDMSFAVKQGYSLVHYFTETYGQQARNAWIGAIAQGTPVDEACQLHLGVSFAELDAQWREWLPTQL